MHKLLTALLLLSMSLSAQASLKVFACEPEWAALASELGGELVDSYSATTAQQDPHYIQARPSLIAKVRRADLVICTGAGLESGWLPLLIRRASNPKVQPGQAGYFEAANYVTLMDKPIKIDRAHGDIHPQGDPHFMMDPNNILKVARALSTRLQTIDSDNKNRYAINTQRFTNQWQQAIQRWQQRAARLKGIKVISQHKSWRYLLRWLQMVEVIRLEAKPGIPPSTAHLARVLEKIKHQPVAMVIRSSYQNAAPAHWLHKQTQVPVVVLPYTIGGNDKVNDLFSLFDDSVTRLLAALNNQ